ncbi:MAG: nucleotide exchange factor GrpE [Vicinamibacteria bacterium]
MPDEDPKEPVPEDGSEASSLEESETRTRLAQAQLEQAMDGYHVLRAENEALRAQLLALHEKHRSATQDIGASLARQKKAAARELQSEREVIYSRYIEILDNFDRAFDTAEARAASHSLMEGFILVRNQVVQVLRDGGFDRVRTLGLPYDPNTSEAIQVEDVDDPVQDGMVIRELVRGYRLDDHIVRAARVVVGRSAAPKKEEKSGEILRVPEDPKDEPAAENPDKDEQA